MVKKLVKIMGICMVLLSLAACGNSKSNGSSSAGDNSDKKTTVVFNWWGSETRHEKYIKAIKLFEKENPNINIKYEYSAFDDYWKKMATKTASGELPDVIQMDAEYIAQYGGKSQLADLSDYAGKGKTIETTDIKKGIVSTGKLDGKLYGIAPAINATSMTVNQDLIDKGGKTVDYNTYTFSDFIKSVKASSKATPGSYGWMDNGENFYILQYYLRTKGQDVFKYSNGKPSLAFTKKNFVDFMQTISDLAKSKALPTAEVALNLKSTEENPMALGNAAYGQGWTNFFVIFNSGLSNNTKLSIELPYDANNGKGALYYRPSFYYSVSKKSKVKKASAKLIDFLVNDEKAGKILGTERGIPSNNKVKSAILDSMSSTEKATCKYLDDIEDKVGDASPIPPLGYSEINTEFKDVYGEVTYGTMTPESAYKRFVSKAKEVLNQNY